MEKGFWEDVDPITSISSSDTIEFLCAANSGVYTDLASRRCSFKSLRVVLPWVCRVWYSPISPHSGGNHGRANNNLEKENKSL
jgi:hypothetical protein